MGSGLGVSFETFERLSRVLSVGEVKSLGLGGIKRDKVWEIGKEEGGFFGYLKTFRVLFVILGIFMSF